MDLSLSVDLLELSVRTSNRLKIAGVKTIEDLVSYKTHQKLFNTGGFGVQCAVELVQCLVEFVASEITKHDHKMAKRFPTKQQLDLTIEKADLFDKIYKIANNRLQSTGQNRASIQKGRKRFKFLESELLHWTAPEEKPNENQNKL